MLSFPTGHRVGDVDAGWTVMTRWLHHERTISGGSPYVTSAGEPGRRHAE